MEQYLTPMGPTKLHVNPIFEISPLEPRFSEWLVFEGLSVDEHGRQHFLDASVAYKRAVLNCIHYLSKFGYTKQQVKCNSPALQHYIFLAAFLLLMCHWCLCSAILLQLWEAGSICTQMWMSQAHDMQRSCDNHSVWLRHVCPCQCCATACSLESTLAP